VFINFDLHGEYLPRQAGRDDLMASITGVRPRTKRYTPVTGAPVVRRLWSAATRDSPARPASAHLPECGSRTQSRRALEDAIRLYLATHNADPKPFVWVKTAHDILSSIARFALRTSETGLEAK
jgi:hypothetical protein